MFSNLITRIRLWYVDKWWLPITTVLIATIIGIFIFFTAFKTINGYFTVRQKPALIRQDAESNRKNFDLLYQQKTAVGDGSYSFTYDLYLRKPFIDGGELQQYISNFIDSVKDKYNGTHTEVRSIGIRIYDRKIVWDMGLTPRLLAQYSLDPDYVESNSNSSSSNDQFNNQITQAGGDPEDITQDTTVAPNALAWQQTNIRGTKINYQNYTITTSGVTNYDNTAVANPLSDKEFAFWLKMKEYEALLNTSSIDGAADLYVNYDLNGKVSNHALQLIEQDFEKFDARETEIGDSTNYFPNQILLEQQLALYRPQLLYFVLSNGELIKSYTKAQNKIIQSDVGDYSTPIKQHDDLAAKNVNKYGRINYYQPNPNVNTDPFVALVGRYKGNYPQIHRTGFVPDPNGNNVFYALSQLNDGETDDD